MAKRFVQIRQLQNCPNPITQNTNVAGIEITGRTVLIMDEVDGMSAGDRGGVGALNGLIKKTRVNIIFVS